MPVVRGRVFPEVGSTGRPKKCLDVLLWGNNWSGQNAVDLDDVEILREYLRSIRPSFCGIRLFVTATHGEIIALLEKLCVRFITVEIRTPAVDPEQLIGDKELASATQTALSCDADVLVTTNIEWFPYIEDVEKRGLFLTDTGFLKFYCEIFVRGHEVPWAFSGSKAIGLTWNGFYHVTEHQTFGTGLDFLYKAQQNKAELDAQETGRSLIHNRLANLCFTRDRLLFYEIQKLAALRAKWKRQEYAFEVAYYLNFYYPLLFGGLDQIALLVNQVLKLGLPEKNVGATYPGFLDVLKAKNARLYAFFADAEHVKFVKRVAYLRHYASHRGSLAPAKLLEKPDKEPTAEQLDAEIAAAGMDDILHLMPESELREGVREMLRANFRMAHYEKGTIIEGVVPIQIDGQSGFISMASLI
jgi:hypothetical protein